MFRTLLSGYNRRGCKIGAGVAHGLFSTRVVIDGARVCAKKRQIFYSIAAQVHCLRSSFGNGVCVGLRWKILCRPHPTRLSHSSFRPTMHRLPLLNQIVLQWHVQLLRVLAVFSLPIHNILVVIMTTHRKREPKMCYIGWVSTMNVCYTFCTPFSKQYSRWNVDVLRANVRKSALVRCKCLVSPNNSRRVLKKFHFVSSSLYALSLVF